MWFPDYCKHCSVGFCNRLDFLPMKCDTCSKIFCKDHFHYKDHSCTNAYMKDIQVPICPLCNNPVPSKRGEQPDIAVRLHIDRDCQADPAIANIKDSVHVFNPSAAPVYKDGAYEEHLFFDGETQELSSSENSDSESVTDDSAEVSDSICEESVFDPSAAPVYKDGAYEEHLFFDRIAVPMIDVKPKEDVNENVWAQDSNIPVTNDHIQYMDVDCSNDEDDKDYLNPSDGDDTSHSVASFITANASDNHKCNKNNEYQSFAYTSEVEKARGFSLVNYSKAMVPLSGSVLDKPDGFAVDLASQNLFVTSSGKNPRIIASNLDGEYIVNIITEELNSPRSLAVDPFEGLLFWSDHKEESEHVIEMSSMDGSNRRVLISESQDSDLNMPEKNKDGGIRIVGNFLENTDEKDKKKLHKGGKILHVKDFPQNTSIKDIADWFPDAIEIKMICFRKRRRQCEAVCSRKKNMFQLQDFLNLSVEEVWNESVFL